MMSNKALVYSGVRQEVVVDDLVKKVENWG